jgi:hypothetical protein
MLIFILQDFYPLPWSFWNNFEIQFEKRHLKLKK